MKTKRCCCNYITNIMQSVLMPHTKQCQYFRIYMTVPWNTGRISLFSQFLPAFQLSDFYSEPYSLFSSILRGETEAFESHNMLWEQILICQTRALGSFHTVIIKQQQQEPVNITIKCAKIIIKDLIWYKTKNRHIVKKEVVMCYNLKIQNQDKTKEYKKLAKLS